MSNAVQYPTMATVKDAAARFGISEYFLRNLCRAGKVRFVCAGNRWLVTSTRATTRRSWKAVTGKTGMEC